MAGGSAMESIRSKLLSPGSSAKLGSFNSQKVPKNCLLHMVPLTQGNWFYQSRFKIQISWLFFKNSDFTSDLNPIYAQIAKKLPSPIYKLLAQFYMDQNFPRHLFIETTATCNLSCSYCPREKIRQDMDFELFRKIINEASKYGTRSFSLHLFGEPLLYPRILDAIRYIKETNKRHVVLVTTNGTKINEFAEELIALKIDQVFWTWRTEATFNESTLETLRKWGRFRVRFIKEITPEDQYKKWSKWPNLETRSLHNYGGDIETWKFGETRSRAQPSKWEFRWPCYHLWFAPAISWNGNIFADVNEFRSEPN